MLFQVSQVMYVVQLPVRVYCIVLNCTPEPSESAVCYALSICKSSQKGNGIYIYLALPSM